MLHSSTHYIDTAIITVSVTRGREELCDTWTGGSSVTRGREGALRHVERRELCDTWKGGSSDTWTGGSSVTRGQEGALTRGREGAL